MFYIQTKDGRVVHDFAFHLINAIEYQNWISGIEEYKFKLIEQPIEVEGDAYPVGDLLFTFKFLKKNNCLDINKTVPINIPKSLNEEKYLKRRVIVTESNVNPFGKRSFVKSATEYKKFVDIVETGQSVSQKDKMYFYSEEVKIDSEWRCFVFGNKMVGAKQYSGDFKIHPDYHLVEEMIKEYNEPGTPNAYTLDVGVNKKGTFIMEVHPFVSCGLYGFDDYKNLVQMTIAGIKYISNTKV